MDEQQERAVARGLRNGEATAWHALYDLHAVRVWRGVARLLGPGSADVADVVQETFLAAARSAHGYDPALGPLWAWVWGIARRHVALYYRRQERHQRLKQAAAWLAHSDGQLGRWLDGTAAAPDALEAAELATLVRATLTELPAHYEELLTARYLDDNSVEQIAVRDGSTATAVRSKLARARQAFREAFGRYTTAQQTRPTPERN